MWVVNHNMNDSQPTHHMNVLNEFAGVVNFVFSWECKLELRFLQSN